MFPPRADVGTAFGLCGRGKSARVGSFADRVLVAGPRPGRTGPGPVVMVKAAVPELPGATVRTARTVRGPSGPRPAGRSR